MFEGLDQIDWKNIGHTPKVGSDEIPVFIRKLIDENGNIDDWAFECLFWGNEVYDSSPHIIPFILEIFPRANDEGKGTLMRTFEWIVRDSDFSDPPLRKLRAKIATYDAIAAGIPLYFALLKSHSPNVRDASISLLGVLYEDAENVLEKLAQHFSVETDEEMKSTVIFSMSNLIRMGVDTYEFRGQANQLHNFEIRHIDFFVEVLRKANSLQLRYTTAAALISHTHPSGLMCELNPKLYPKLPEPLFLAANALIEDYSKYATSSIFDREQKRSIISNISRVGTEYLLRLLNRNQVSSQEAQWIAKGIVRIAFHRRFHEYEHYFDGIEHLIKENVVCDVQPCIEIGLDAKQREAIRIIVGMDKFWKLPTHLFSLYCGLPDSRDELRALIEKTDA